MIKFDSSRLADLCQEHGVTRLRVFGSEAKGTAHPGSDLDVIADFGEGTGYFGLIRFEAALSELFGRPVDIVTEPGLSPYMREGILASASVIFADARSGA